MKSNRCISTAQRAPPSVQRNVCPLLQLNFISPTNLIIFSFGVCYENLRSLFFGILIVAVANLFSPGLGAKTNVNKADIVSASPEADGDEYCWDIIELRSLDGETMLMCILIGTIDGGVIHDPFDNEIIYYVEHCIYNCWSIGPIWGQLRLEHIWVFNLCPYILSFHPSLTGFPCRRQ